MLVSPDYTISPLTPSREVLDNGLTVLLLEDHDSPVVTVRAWVGAGSATEDEYFGSGISHFVEHMLFKGTERRAVGQMGREVKGYGGRTNAYTAHDRTVYYITVNSEYLSEALDIMSDALMHSSFDPAEVEKERQVILREIDMNRDDPGRTLYRLAWETCFAVHPYRYPVIGYRDALERITREDLLKYYHTRYVPDNIALVVVGDFQTDEVLPGIQDAFKEFPRRLPPALPRPAEPRQLGVREVVREYPVEKARVLIGYHGPDIYSPDLFAIDVLAVVLGDGKTSRLNLELRERRQIVYSVYCFSDTPRDPGLFIVGASMAPEKLDEATEAILSEIARIRAELVSTDELAAARAKVLGDFMFGRQTVEGLAGELGFNEQVAHDLNFSKRYVEGVGRVRADDLRRVAGKYLSPHAYSVVQLVPEKPEAKVAGPTGQERPQIQKLVLDNGLTLLLREDHSVQLAAVQVVFLGGLRTEDEENNGITNLMRLVMLKGTDHRSAEEIFDEIESKGGRIRSFSGRNTFGFTLEVLSEDLLHGLDVLSDVLLHPSFPPEEVEKERQMILAEIKALDENIFAVSRRLFRKTIFQGHPYRFLDQGSQDTVASLTREDLVDFHRRMLDPRKVAIAVFGDMDAHVIAQWLEETFGGLRPSLSAPVDPPPAVFPTSVRKAAERMPKEQSFIMLGFPSVDFENEDRAAFDVLAEILSDQGGRLFHSLRDVQGLAYAVGAYHIPGVDPGSFVFYIATAPVKRQEAIEGLIEEITKLREDLVGADEFERAKAGVLGNYIIELQTNTSKAWDSALNELYGLGYDQYLRYPEQVRTVTAEKVREVVRRYFDLDRYTLVIVGPDAEEG